MALRLEQISKSFPSTGTAVEAVDIEIPDGQFVSLLGPSGCGKSTVLRMIAGLEEPSSGTVRYGDGGVLPANALSYVFQEPRLLPWRRVAANVRLPLEMSRPRPADWAERVAAALHLVELEDFANAYPSELSGGMKMRVSLARALVTQPSLLLLDEPFGALDEITRQTLNHELMALWQAKHWTSVFVTHNVFEAVYLSQRILVMSQRPAVIAADIEVPFPYPRSPSLRAEEAFGKLVGQVLSQLHEGIGDAT